VKHAFQRRLGFAGSPLYAAQILLLATLSPPPWLAEPPAQLLAQSSPEDVPVAFELKPVH